MLILFVSFLCGGALNILLSFFCLHAEERVVIWDMLNTDTNIKQKVRDLSFFPLRCYLADQLRFNM